MNCVVVYKSKYGATKAYAQWIAEELGCEALDARKVKIDDLLSYDTIIYGGGLYAEVIAGVTLLTKNLSRLQGKKLIVYTTAITPLEYVDYYEKYVIPKNFKGDSISQFKVFHFLGKMILSELSLVHRTALKTLKKIMSDKENPTEMERLLITLCDCDGDFSDRNAIEELVRYAKEEHGEKAL